MVSPMLKLTSILVLASIASAQSYTNNTNTNCATSSDIDYQKTYSYNSADTMDWGFYTRSTGTCDSGSYARVHVVDPSGNDIDCGYVALDGNLNLVSCSNYPRGYMQEGQYTMYWETVPGAGQYSWNQFTVSHSQSTVTAPTPTQTVTTTPLTVVTTTLTNSPTDTKYVDQVTVTTPSATMTNTIKITPPGTTITTTTTSFYSLVYRVYTQSTYTAITTATCRSADITPDKTGKRKTGTTSSTSSGTKTTKTTTPYFFWWWRRSVDVSEPIVARDASSLELAAGHDASPFRWWSARRNDVSAAIHRLRVLRLRDGDVPNTVGVIGQQPTTTITPDAVLATSTAATSTSTVTSTTNLPAVTVTSQNPTPTLTVFSGVAVQSTTQTLPQSTKSVVKTKLALTIVTSTSTLVYTKKVVTTPVCAPSST